MFVHWSMPGFLQALQLTGLFTYPARFTTLLDKGVRITKGLLYYLFNYTTNYVDKFSLDSD